MKKRLFSIIALAFAVVMCFVGLVACKSSEEKPVEKGTTGLEFRIDKEVNEAYLVGIGDAVDTHIIIPSKHQGYTVTKIAAEAFFEEANIISVTIPNSVKKIEEEAFSSCLDLETVKFENNSNLEEMEDAVFASCEKLKTVDFGENSKLKEVGYQAFTGCEVLESVKLPVNLTVIEGSAFSACESLEEIDIPETLEHIKVSAFRGCKKLKQVTFKSTSQLKSIGDSAFYGCISLKNIEIPTSVISFGPSAFGNCSLLESIEIPSGVEYMAYSTFSGCTNLQYKLENGLMYLGNSENEYFYLWGLAASHMNTISTMTINSNCKIIGSYILDRYNPTSLTKVIIPSGVISISPFAFYRQSNLKTVEFEPNSKLQNLGGYAFSGCTSLESIEIPSSVKNIGYSVFDSCDKLKYTIEGNLKYLGNSQNKYLMLVDTTSNDITSASINSNCKVIGSYAFSSCTLLNSIIIPSNVVRINNSAFSGCSSLKTITIPSSVSMVGGSAFYNCKALTGIIFEDSDNWYRVKNETDFEMLINGEEKDVTDPVDNLAYFRIEYTYMWYKKA